jgi:hypothetical protein
LALSIFVDVPQTIRIKALVINILPLDPQTKVDAVMNLCEAAFAGGPISTATNCFLAHRSNTAAEEAARRRKEVTNDASRRKKCEEYNIG